MSLPIVTSAPGKVIIFGEHSAVFKEPVIAASVSSLRSYLLVTATDDENVIELDFPDIKLDNKWKRQDIAVLKECAVSAASSSHNELSQELGVALEPLLANLNDPLHYHAAYCFLYLYTCLCGAKTGLKFTVKSTLPIGAGLGSSASISVCLALAMGILGGHISDSGDKLSNSDLSFVNTWSFIGEKCINGTPSGIDNAVATYGNAVSFQRQDDNTIKFERILDFPQIPLILTNTKIPRSTKTLVGNVVKLAEREPLITKPILSAMGHIATRGAEILSSLSDENYPVLLELVRLNHGLLVSLGVSHPGLEVIRSLSDTMKIGSTKLTGAGGGGCALTLIDKNASDSEIDEFKSQLQKDHGYVSLSTGLGGMGCSYVSSEKLKGHVASLATVFARDTTVEEIDSVLLPNGGPLSWVH
ncbi:LAMI_0A04522g1_1 [Lachancea mirantina]|uniref:Mevalonate kinase n=1 Tax=Lachancea mirantina TaxID=1230905 RepID=A0A1G4IP18_9SACH|nr:LAMI_0A04522g1_1 [Lachancea mirantina]